MLHELGNWRYLIKKNIIIPNVVIEVKNRYI